MWRRLVRRVPVDAAWTQGRLTQFRTRRTGCRMPKCECAKREAGSNEMARRGKLAITKRLEEEDERQKHLKSYLVKESSAKYDYHNDQFPLNTPKPKRTD